MDDNTVMKERKRWLLFGLPFTFTQYILNDRSLTLKKGFFTTTEDDILLFRVMDVSLRRSLFQRMAGLGTLTVMSSDKTNPSLQLKNIKHVREFKDALDERVDRERVRLRFKTGEVIGADGDDCDCDCDTDTDTDNDSDDGKN